MSNPIKFIPIRGLDENIKEMPYQDGYLYFATDTKQIYLDAKGQNKIPMGGGNASGAGIIFGNKTLSIDEEAESIINFTLDKLNIDYLPGIDSVILNIPDGYFYRVISVSASTNTISTTRLAIAGSGGGGGENTAQITLNIISGAQSGDTFVYGQSSNLIFKGNVDNGDTQMIYMIYVTNVYAGKETTKAYGPFINPVDTEYSFDLGSVLPLGTNTVKIAASSDNAGVTKTHSITLLNCVEMFLEKSEDFNPLKFNTGKFNFYCIPVGEDLTKTVNIYIDDVLYPSLVQSNIKDTRKQLTFEIPPLTHGTHTIKAVLTCAESAATTSLSYNVCCVESGVDSPIIWINSNVPNSIVNHDILTIEYMVYNPLSTIGVETHYYINSAEIPTSPLEVSYSQISWLKWRVIGYGLGDNALTIKCGTTELTIPVFVAVDTKRNLDIVTSGLHVNLNALGRSNNENIQSRQTWTSQSLYDPSIITSVKFNDFNWYNNGWITDDEGETCLRISNGASIEIPLNVMNTKALSDSLAFEFVFKVRNVQNYSTLINTVVDNPESENPTIRKEVSSTDGVWGSYYDKNIGFCLGTQEAFFKSKNALVSGRYKEDELVHVSFVIEAAGANSNANKLIYIYINGINSGITKYNISTDSLESGCRTLRINSNYCDIDLYKLRVYKSNLTAQYVVQNYLADYNSAELYDMNEEIVDYNNGIPSINFTKMVEYNANHPEALLMPYMIIETTDTADTLPYKKIEIGDAWKVNIEFVNPTLDYEYENNLWTDKDLSDRGYTSKDEMYFHSCPSYKATNVDFNVQGTSSQGYPIRNYKAKFKNASSWEYTAPWAVDSSNKQIKISKGGTTASGYKVGKKWFMDSQIGENKTTLKADYMDSSSVHNTGFASFVKTLYSKHPLNDYANLPSDCDTTKLRTSVYGFPILMFHKKHDGTYKFLGRYNYNLDKGCDDTFGFCDWGDDHYVDVTALLNANNFDASKLYIKEGEEYIALEETAIYNNSITYYRLDEAADSNALNPDYDPIDPYSRQYLPWSQAAECWEFSNNQGGRCSLKKADFEEVDENGELTVINDFEYRYNADADSFDNAYAGVGQAIKSNGEVFTSQEELNAFIIKKMSRWEKFCDWIISTDATQATNEPLDEAVNYGKYNENGELIEYTVDSAEYRLAKFANEFNLHLDKEYCLIYYIMTELLICYDSRGKNLMMATWGPKVRGGEDIWYPIFYDIDTQLGVNNSGVPYWDYYEEATQNGTFSTPDSVLWVNLWNCFSSEIKNKYDELTGVKLTINNLDGYYRFDPEVSKSKAMCGYRPMILNNVDEYQKYIAPSISGYVDTAGTSGIITDTFYYCLQGTRELQRALFLRNRFNYLGSQWQSDKYSLTAAKQGIQTRFDANDYLKDKSRTSDKYLNRQPTPEEASAGYEYAEYGTQPLDFNYEYQVTPYLKQYISYWYDDTKSGISYAGDGETITVPMLSNKINELINEPHKTQQLIYWGGAEYVSSLGDLSNKYLDQLWISSAKRLKDLIIGSDIPGYYNKMINSTSFKPDDSATVTVKGVTRSNPNAKTLLEKVVLTNLSGLDGTLDFSGSEKLKELRALGTNVSSFILADGVQISKLYLPNTITNLILKEPTSLTGILTNAEAQAESVTRYDPVSVTKETYNKSIHYINTLDGYKRCDDVEYFGYYYLEALDVTNDNYSSYGQTLYRYNINDKTYKEETEEDIFLDDVMYYTRHEGTEYNETRNYYVKVIEDQQVYPVGLYIDNLTNIININADSKTYLSTIDIVGGNMGYDSYALLNKAMNIKKQMIANTSLSSEYDKHLSINLERVNWTPYRLVEIGETPSDLSVYHILNSHDEFELYNKVSNEYPNWDLNVANGYVYEYDEDVFEAHKNDITNLDMLDTFIEDYQEAKDIYDSLIIKDNFDKEHYNYYKSTDSFAQGPTLAALTGTIYINNPPDEPIDEVAIKNYYHDTYYPKLNIQVANIAKANVVKFVEIVDEETGKEYIWDTKKYSSDIIHPELTTVTASKLNYDFAGWSIEKKNQAEINNMTTEQLNAILLTDETVQNLSFTTDGIDNVITLYAVYTIHSYTITYLYPNGDLIDIVSAPSSGYVIIPQVVPYKDDSMLPTEETWQFVGYARTPTAGLSEVIVYNPNDKNTLNILSTSDLTLYAVFNPDPISVYDNIHPEFFVPVQVPNGSYDYKYNDDIDSSFNITGVQLGLIKQVKGKITIPAIFEGKPVVSIDPSFGAALSDNLKRKIPLADYAWDGYGYGSDLTHIFIQKNEKNIANFREIVEATFYCTPNLKYFDFCPGIRKIKAGAFYNNDTFGTGQGSLISSTIANDICLIGERAFHVAFDASVSEIIIGSKVREIGNEAFVYTSRYSTDVSRKSLDNITIGSSSEKSALLFTANTKFKNYTRTTNEENKPNIFIYTNDIVDENTLRTFFGIPSTMGIEGMIQIIY